MEKIKRISAAVLAMALACGMMASCGGTDNSSSAAGDTTTTAAAAEESKADEAKTEESKADDGAEAKTEESKAEESAAETDTAEDTGVDLAAITPDPNYKHTNEFQGYDAMLMFADQSGWFWANMMPEGSVHFPDFDAADPNAYGYGVDADIVGDGEYTVKLTKDSIYQNNGITNAQVLINEDNGTIFPAEGAQVFCIDIIGLMNGDFVSGLNKDTGEWEMDQEAKKNKLKDGDPHYDKEMKGDYKPSDLKVEVTSIKADGKEIEFDNSKIKYGNIEDNNNCYRIELYNAWGTTAQDPPIADPLSLTFNESLEVTFTIEGLGEVKTFPEVAPFGDGAAAEEKTEETAAEEKTEEAAAEEKTEETATEEKAE